MGNDKITGKPKETALQERLERRTRTIDVGGPQPKRIFDQVSIVSVVLDTNMRVVRYNRAAERLFRQPYSSVLGCPYDEVLPLISEVNRDHIFQRTIALGVPSEEKEVRIEDSATGEVFYFDFVVDPVLDDNARMAGVSIIGLDVTERALLKQRLAHQNEDLLALQQVSNALRKTMDLEKVLFIIASALTSAEGGSYDHAIIFTVDQDRENLIGQICVDSIGLRDAWGIWRGLTSHDAPLQKSLESTQPVLARRWGDLSELVRSVKVPLGDETSILVHAVRTGETVTHETMKEDPHLHVHPAIAKHFPLKKFAAAPLLADREAIGVIVVDASSRKQEVSPERLTMLEMFANQAALAINNGLIYQNVLDRAQRDSLTRLYNHGHFQEVMRSEIERAERYNNPLSLIMLDIDHFKRFNDTYGHQTGDRVLKQTALLLSALVRVTDLPARYGGEEFALLLPQTDYDHALELAERLRIGVERKVVVAGPAGQKIGVTASFGVASYPRHAAEAHDLVMCADAALYVAKDRGRNCVVGTDDVDDIEETTELKKATKRPTMKRPTMKQPPKQSAGKATSNQSRPGKSEKKDGIRVKTPGSKKPRKSGKVK
ncbi:MAG: diguanylate cyclase [Planctomycetes bacterium]|nr:diguanylate cyclase [Planctomycetota bacterium]